MIYLKQCLTAYFPVVKKLEHIIYNKYNMSPQKEETMENEEGEKQRRTSVSKEYSEGEGNQKGDSESEQTPFLEWSKENEDILAEWCDVAQCYKWLNLKAHQKYSRLHAWFTIPAITLSTITGTAAFAQTSLPVSMQSYAPMVIGTINIMIGILTTVQQYLKISELNEAHRVAGISWDKFARNIRIELAKKLDERIIVNINKLKHNFQSLLKLQKNITDVRTTAHKKLQESKQVYNDLSKKNNKKVLLFCLDAFFFQYKTFTLEMEHLDKFRALLNNRVYCDYYKLNQLIVEFIQKNKAELDIEETQTKSFPTYKELEPFQQY